jgi:hypothetical protein
MGQLWMNRVALLSISLLLGFVMRWYTVQRGIRRNITEKREKLVGAQGACSGAFCTLVEQLFKLKDTKH